MRRTAVMLGVGTFVAVWLAASPASAQTSTTDTTTATTVPSSSSSTATTALSTTAPTTAVPEPVTPATTNPSPGHEPVSFCHRTNSVTNPYNLLTTDADSIIQQGHGSHTGPIFPADDWGDIIPPFENSDGTFPGLNWPAGAAVLDAACAV